MKPNAQNYREILKREFEADEGSFLIQLHNLEFNKVAFARLLVAMDLACELTASDDKLERWMAAGFWDIPKIVRGKIEHPDCHLPGENEFYQRAVERLDALADQFFHS